VYKSITKLSSILVRFLRCLIESNTKTFFGTYEMRPSGSHIQILQLDKCASSTISAIFNEPCPTKCGLHSSIAHNKKITEFRAPKFHLKNRYIALCKRLHTTNTTSILQITQFSMLRQNILDIKLY